MKDSIRVKPSDPKTLHVLAGYPDGDKARGIGGVAVWLPMGNDHDIGHPGNEKIQGVVIPRQFVQAVLVNGEKVFEGHNVRHGFEGQGDVELQLHPDIKLIDPLERHRMVADLREGLKLLGMNDPFER